MDRPKQYKDYCREALEKEYDLYKFFFNPDGSKKRPPVFKGKDRHSTHKEMLHTELKQLPITGPVGKLKVKVTGAAIKQLRKNLDMTIWDFPKDCSRKEYNRIWMHNYRVRQRLKKLNKDKPQEL